MKTLLVINVAPQFGGHEVMLCEILRELKRHADVSVHVLSLEGGRLQQELAPIASGLHGLKHAAGVRYHLELARKLLALRLKLNPDAVLVANGYLGEIFNLLMARLCFRMVLAYTPLIVSFGELGSTWPGLKDALFRFFTSRLANLWVVLSAGQVRRFEELAGPGAAATCIQNVLRPEFEKRARAAQRAADLGQRPLRVLVLGRLDVHHKGLDFLSDHLVRHADELRGQVVFSIVGDGAGRGYLDEQGLPDFVHRKPWSDAVQELQDHDVLFMPSRYEGVPLVMLEAMAMGRPVVASRLPGVQDYLPAELVFPIGDMDAAFAILNTLREPDRHERCVNQLESRVGRVLRREEFQQEIEQVFSLAWGGKP